MTQPSPARHDRPSDSVLRAFAVDGAPRPLPGGQGTAWLAGDLVLKPGGGAVHEWLATAIEDLDVTGIRVAAPVRTVSGSWLSSGWSANRWVEGREPDYSQPSTWLAIIEAGRAFHEAVAHLERPDCLGERVDPWALADRAAWGEREIRFRPEFREVARRLEEAVGPLGASQVVHGDLTGNVLLGPDLPAVIDISPYWRPPEYAEGIVLADALTWHGASTRLLQRAHVSAAAVARGLLFRMATSNERLDAGQATGVDVGAEARRYSCAAAALGA